MGSESFVGFDAGVERLRVAGGHVTVLEAFFEHDVALAVGDDCKVVLELGRDRD